MTRCTSHYLSVARVIFPALAHLDVSVYYGTLNRHRPTQTQSHLLMHRGRIACNFCTCPSRCAENCSHASFSTACGYVLVPNGRRRQKSHATKRCEMHRVCNVKTCRRICLKTIQSRFCDDKRWRKVAASRNVSMLVSIRSYAVCFADCCVL